MNHKGFTMFELVLTATLLAVLSFPVVYLLNEGTRGYTNMFSRVESSQDARAGLQRLKDELVLLSSAKITAVASNRIDFLDSGNAATNFRLQGTNLVRGNDLLVDNVQSLTFTYKDQNNVATNVVANVRRIAIDMRVAPQGTNTPVVYQMEVFPRNFMYQSFQ